MAEDKKKKKEEDDVQDFLDIISAPTEQAKKIATGIEELFGLEPGTIAPNPEKAGELYEDEEEEDGKKKTPGPQSQADILFNPSIV